MLTHKGTKRIKTRRLVLKRFKEGDAKEMFESWASDERVTKYLTWQAHKSVEETRAILKVWCAEYAYDNRYQWAMEYKGALIGNISVVNYSEGHEYAVIGYCSAVKYWGQGFMTEALEAVLEFLFNEVGFHRVELRHIVENVGSGRVAQKCGMQYEGTARQIHRYLDGSFADLAKYGILKEEWQKNKERR